MGDVKRLKLSGDEPTTVDDNVTDFIKKSDNTDFALVVEEKKLYVSKFILSLTSPVFKQMLNSNFKEKNQDEIELPNKKYAEVLEFLKCVYPGILKLVTMDTVFDVLPLADEYLVHNLKEQCQQVLLANTFKTTPTDGFCKFMSIASKFGLEDLLQKCILLAGNTNTSAEDLCIFILVAVKCELVEFQEKCVKLAGNLPGSVFRAEADKFNLPIQIQAAIYKIICIKQSQELSGQSKLLSRQSQLLSSIKSHGNGCADSYFGKKLKANIDAIPNR